ncbi:hypothetical protein [Ammoniphilus resinae]|uniref:Tfp pilus assembly protein FimT n=1 Tax=Ammoniphilus resinae TaxID=861532 RepID=A0ABS4GRD6_9BACL|nr:hypothetical protein [Ammoniphilus resinae]MBP1932828.1 Tfp pilus assembly protein FimT [Ammoniphilus resinae]
MNQTGYSYLELSVVIAMVTLLFLVSGPIYAIQLQKQQTQLITRQISNDLYLAANEARTKQIIYYFNIVQPGLYMLSSSQQSQKKARTLPKGYSLKSNFFNNRIVFNAYGRPTSGGTLTLTDPKGSIQRFVIQIVSGRFRVADG